MIFLKPDHLQIIQEILRNYPQTFYIFGSRVTGKARPLSDVDLCYKEPMSIRERRRLVEEFENSALPFTVDLVDYARCSPSFKEIIDKQLVLFPKE